MLNDWSHKVRAILKKYCPGNIKKYCPPHKARGIHDFILATKSSVWIIIPNNIIYFVNDIYSEYKFDNIYKYMLNMSI